jgi:hypothetical protein
MQERRLCANICFADAACSFAIDRTVLRPIRWTRNKKMAVFRENT